MFIKFTNKRLKVIKEFKIIHSIIPRDIIPITTYFSDFVEVSTKNLNTINANASITNNYDTYIP
jgi:hypothetical protein